MIRALFSQIALSVGMAFTGPALAQDTSVPKPILDDTLGTVQVTGTGTVDPQYKDCDGVRQTNKTDGTIVIECIKNSPEEKLDKRVFSAAEFSPFFNCAVAVRQYNALTGMIGQKTSPVIEKMLRGLEDHFLQDVRNTVGHKPDEIDYVGHRARFVLDGETAAFRGSIHALEYALKSKVPTTNLLESFRSTAYTAVNYCSQAILGYNFHSSFDGPQNPRVEITGVGKNGSSTHLNGPKQEK